MLVMKVYLNDRLIASCGRDDLEMLAADIYRKHQADGSNEFDLIARFSGTLDTADTRNYVKWLDNIELALNDEISIEFVDDEHADQPSDVIVREVEVE